jgi:hypothetical protein
VQDTTFPSAINVAEAKLLLLVFVKPYQPDELILAMSSTVQASGAAELPCWPARASASFDCYRVFADSGRERPDKYPVDFMLEYLRDWCAAGRSQFPPSIEIASATGTVMRVCAARHRGCFSAPRAPRHVPACEHGPATAALPAKR